MILCRRLHIYIYICRIVQCALLVTIIMALWQLANLGTQCTVTHCRIAYCEVTRVLKAVSSERCINANSERFSERLSTQSIRVLNRIYLEHNTFIWISGWIFQKVIDSYRHGVPSTPPPNHAASSSYKTHSCLNIRPEGAARFVRSEKMLVKYFCN